MGFANGYRGQVGGSVQNSYTDQPGVAYAGMVAFASDLKLADAMLVGEALGIAAGKGVRRVEQTASATNFQTPNALVYLPAGTETAADFAGVLLFDEAMQSDENGVNGWAAGRVARIMRSARAGGRVYVKAIETIEVTDTVHWVIVAPVDGSYEVGEFCPNSLAGGDAGTSVFLPNCRWETPASAGGFAIMELLGTSNEFVGVSDSSS